MYLGIVECSDGRYGVPTCRYVHIDTVGGRCCLPALAPAAHPTSEPSELGRSVPKAGENDLSTVGT